MVAALKALGFDYVFDTTFGADLTSMEEAHELKLRIEKNKKGMFTSCCPSWVKYASIYHPDILKDLSSCDSPIGMESTIIKKYFAKEEDIDLSKFILVALTPCTSKKEEIINRVLIGGESVWTVAIDEGIQNDGTLRNWIKKYKENGYNIVERRCGRSPTMSKKEFKSKANETIEEENERLRKENLYLKAELEYSKKLRAVVQARKNQQQKKK